MKTNKLFFVKKWLSVKCKIFCVRAAIIMAIRSRLVLLVKVKSAYRPSGPSVLELIRDSVARSN